MSDNSVNKSHCKALAANTCNWPSCDCGDGAVSKNGQNATLAQGSETLSLLREAASVLTNVCQILDAVKQEWGAEKCWSSWDQSVRDAATEWLRSFHAMQER